MEDFDTVNPMGRLDVVAYRSAEYLTNVAAQRYGLSGVWDILKPHVAKLVNQHVTPIKLPIEAQVLLSIIQANYRKGEIS